MANMGKVRMFMATRGGAAVLACLFRRFTCMSINSFYFLEQISLLKIK